jgi:hypothetical protein
MNNYKNNNTLLQLCFYHVGVIIVDMMAVTSDSVVVVDIVASAVIVADVEDGESFDAIVDAVDAVVVEEDETLDDVDFKGGGDKEPLERFAG